MKEKRKDCLYCGKEMLEVKTIRKKFCSDLCRVNFNHEVKYEKEVRKVLDNPIFNKLKRDVIFNLIVYGQSSIPEEKLKEIAKNSTEGSKPTEEFKNEVYIANAEIKSSLKSTETEKEVKTNSNFESECEVNIDDLVKELAELRVEKDTESKKVCPSYLPAMQFNKVRDNKISDINFRIFQIEQTIKAHKQ